MSLVTTCPACGTRFRVRPEQLAAHRGDVRCGQCDHVFNALEQLDQALTPSTASPIDSGLPQDNTSAAEAMPQDRPDENAPAIATDPALPEFKDTEETPEDTAAEAHPEADAGVELLPANRNGQTLQDDLPDEITPLPAAPAPAVTAKAGSTLSPATVLAVHQSSGRSGYPWLLGLTGLLLILSAVAQLSYFMRTELAAMYPALRPALERACAEVGCSVALPRNIHLLAIDDSDLQEDVDYQNVIVLSSTLINNAPYDQAFPSLELTLTDLGDQPVLRRKFSPSEYLPAQHTAAAGMHPGEEVRVRLSLSVEGIRPTGYRVYLVYP